MEKNYCRYLMESFGELYAFVLHSSMTDANFYFISENANVLKQNKGYIMDDFFESIYSDDDNDWPDFKRWLKQLGVTFDEDEYGNVYYDEDGTPMLNGKEINVIAKFSNRF